MVCVLGVGSCMDVLSHVLSSNGNPGPLQEFLIWVYYGIYLIIAIPRLYAKIRLRLTIWLLDNSQDATVNG